jgi:hypothetical protein
MSTLTTPSAQSLNFEFKTNWSTTKWPQTKDKLKKGHLEYDNHKNQELARSDKRQMQSQRKTQHSP